MDLILWRHAEAEDPRPGLPDERRRLTPKGEKQARKMAKWLKKRLPKNTRILVSPTERTRMTAHALDMPFEVERRVGGEADAKGLLAAVYWPDSSNAVLVVGHQPTLGRAAALLLAGSQSDWVIRKGGIWWLSSRGRTEVPILEAVVGPSE